MPGHSVKMPFVPDACSFWISGFERKSNTQFTPSDLIFSTSASVPVVGWPHRKIQFRRTDLLGQRDIGQPPKSRKLGIPCSVTNGGDGSCRRRTGNYIYFVHDSRCGLRFQGAQGLLIEMLQPGHFSAWRHFFGYFSK